MDRKPVDNTTPGRAALSFLLPLDVTAIRRPSATGMIWGSIFFVWLISLLPWRLWPPAPDLLLLVILFWCLNEPDRVGMMTAFVLGLLMDVHDADLLGDHALAYTLAAYGAVVLNRRLQRFGAAVQALHMLPVVLASEAVSHFVHAWLAGEWAGWQWVGSALLTVALWPLADILLLLPRRRLDGVDPGQG
ncbi:MAG: rod shape-determining protein MreD [Candidimonas sp.]|nr:MAG: rod shape-determining protein MreD [Candidimonas sp.]